MITLILLTTLLPFTTGAFVFMCATVIFLARSGYPDESVKPPPGKWWPRLTLRAIWVILRAKGPDTETVSVEPRAQGSIVHRAASRKP